MLLAHRAALFRTSYNTRLPSVCMDSRALPNLQLPPRSSHWYALLKCTSTPLTYPSKLLPSGGLAACALPVAPYPMLSADNGRPSRSTTCIASALSVPSAESADAGCAEADGATADTIPATMTVARTPLTNFTKPPVGGAGGRSAPAHLGNGMTGRRMPRPRTPRHGVNASNSSTPRVDGQPLPAHLSIAMTGGRGGAGVP